MFFTSVSFSSLCSLSMPAVVQPADRDTFLEYYQDPNSKREYMKVWRRELTWQSSDTKPPHDDFVHLEWFEHANGTWTFDLWRLNSRRLLLTGLETARLLSTETARGRTHDRSRSRDRGDLEIDQLQSLLSKQDLRE